MRKIPILKHLKQTYKHLLPRLSTTPCIKINFNKNLAWTQQNTHNVMSQGQRLGSYLGYTILSTERRAQSLIDREKAQADPIFHW